MVSQDRLLYSCSQHDVERLSWAWTYVRIFFVLNKTWTILLVFCCIPRPLCRWSCRYPNSSFGWAKLSTHCQAPCTHTLHTLTHLRRQLPRTVYAHKYVFRYVFTSLDICHTLPCRTHSDICICTHTHLHQPITTIQSIWTQAQVTPTQAVGAWNNAVVRRAKVLWARVPQSSHGAPQPNTSRCLEGAPMNEWNEKKWNEMNQTKWNEMKWIKQNEMKWDEMNESRAFPVFDRSIRKRPSCIMAERGGDFAWRATDWPGVRQ